MKFIFEIILATIIIFFLWNILKRLFFTAIYRAARKHERPTERPEKKKVEPKINWDAETVDYEEVKENKKT